MKQMYRIIGALLAIALLGYFLYYARNAFGPAVLATMSSVPAISAMLAAAALYGLIIPLSAWAWSRLLASAGVSWPLSHLVGIMGSTQIAKYLPGNIAQHAGRTALSLAKGMRIGDFIISVTIETVLALLSALVVGLVCLIASPAVFPTFPRHLSVLVAILFAVLAGSLPALPRFVRWPASALAAKRGVDAAQWRFEIPHVRAQLLAFAAYCANYLLIGLAFLLIARVVGVGDSIGYLQLTAAFALSWLAGFVAPGLPAGLGVREGVMALILSGTPASPGVLSAILAMRLSTMAGDAAWFVIGGWLLVRSTQGARQ